MADVVSQALWFEVLLIGGLILLNGFFAGSEIALISARRTRVRQLAQEGNPRAQVLERLQADPDRFLATVQIGVTFLGTLASAVGGVLAVRFLQPLVAQVPWGPVQRGSGAIAVAAVVLALTYLSLVVGELVPKTLALRHSEPFALAVAGPLDALGRLVHPLTLPLSGSTNLILRLVGGGGPAERPFVSEEEIKLMVEEGRAKGVFDQTEQELIHRVFEFTEASVKEVMVPRHQIHAIPLDTPTEEVLRIITEAGHSRYPVYRKDLDDTCGVLYYKDLLPLVVAGKPIVLAELLHPIHFAPETAQVSRLLKELQRRRMHMAAVVDEYGGVVGIVTIEDLIEEIVGEIHDEYDTVERPVQRLKDGSLIVDASMTIRDLQGQYDLPFPESPEYETVAGFVLAQLQRIPKGGEIVVHGEHKFTVVDMDGRRVTRVKVEPATRK